MLNLPDNEVAGEVRLHTDEYFTPACPPGSHLAPHEQEGLLPAQPTRTELTPAVVSPSLHSFSSPSATPLHAGPSKDAGTMTQQRWQTDMREVETYVISLDEARADCAAAGRFQGAELCVRRMERVLRLLARHLSSEVNATAERTRYSLAEQQKAEQLNFRKQWKERIVAYERNAASILVATKQHHYAQVKREDLRAREELRSAEKKSILTSSSSSELQRLQSELQLYLRQRRYKNAERVQTQLHRLEKQERKSLCLNLQRANAQRVQTLTEKHSSELAKMKAAHQEEKQSMCDSGRKALDNLLHEHQLALRAVEEWRELLQERIQAIMKHYDSAEVIDPIAAVRKLLRLAQVFGEFYPT